MPRRSLTFLVIDDNQLQRRIVDSCLEPIGHQVMFAVSADEVEGVLSVHDAAVVLLSAALPIGVARDALAASMKPRRDEETFALLPPPMVAVGAGPADMAAARELIDRGASGIVARPYDRRRLVPQLELFALGAKPATVLVVDDSNLIRKRTVEALDKAGHTVLQAVDGREALAELRTHPEIEVVVSDVVMPNLDGYGLTQAIRSQAETAGLPVILLTALDDIAAQSQAVEAGADDILIKPITATELQMRVRTTMRVKALQRRLGQSNEQLRESLDLRTRFTRMLVHDFRSPLTAMMIAAEIAGDLCSDGGLTEAHSYLEDVLQGGTRLAGLTSDLLRVAQLEEGAVAPHRENFSMCALARELAVDMQRLAEQRKLTIEVVAEGELMVDADRSWIYRVVQNLVDNALRHSPKQTSVELRVAASEHYRGMLRVEIADSGVGIPAEHRDHVFRQFAQLPTTERRGTGLGLTFCRLAVEAHGGTICADERSDGKQGALFWFTIPLLGE